MWNNFDEMLPSNSNSNNNSSNKRSNSLRYKHEFGEMKQGLEDHYSLPVQEEAAVAQYVQNIHRVMYPEANSRPTDWINAVVGTYKQIRKQRVVEFRRAKGKPLASPRGQLAPEVRVEVKKEYMAAMKGLRMHVIVGCILRCLLVQDNVGIPVRILLRYMNEALKFSLSKKEATPITLEQLERYRYDTKSKGIRQSLQKVVPRCYEKMSPESLVSYTGYSLLRLGQADVQRAMRLARAGVRVFDDLTPSGDIAIGALFSVMVSLGLHKSKSVDLLAMPKTRLTALYKGFKNSNDPVVHANLGTTASPSTLFRTPKKMVASSKKRSL